MIWQSFIALRYLTRRRKEKFISVISLISILGVAVGVAALIIVIAVMSGFDEDLKDKIVGMNSHIVIESDCGLKHDKDLITKALNVKHVTAASFFVNGQALIRQDDNVMGIVVRGIDPKEELKVNDIGKYVKGSSLDLGPDGVIIGSELAEKLGLKAGDPLNIVTPSYVDGERFKVSSLFTSGMYEYDLNFVFIDIRKAKDLFGAKALASGIAVRVDEAFNAVETKKLLQKEFGFPYVVRTWMDLNKNLLAALKLEKTVMFIILTLIVMVACFNIASMLIMTVLDKTKDIGILKAIGAANLDIKIIFALQGGAIGLAGTALGSAIGILICWCLKTYKFIALPKDIYYIDTLPVKLELQDIALIVLSSLLITLVATIYPSYKASRLDPVEALRYE